jgi:hypothetical protein
MHASSSALLAKKAAVGQHELVRDSARHDRYELAADRPCASTMMGQSLLSMLAGTVFLCPLNKPGLSECVDWNGSSSDSDSSVLIYWDCEYRVYVMVGRGLRGWESSRGFGWMQRNVVVEVSRHVPCQPVFFTQSGPRSRHRHSIGSQQLTEQRGGVPNVPRDDYSPGRGAVTRQGIKEAHRSTSSHRVVLHLYPQGGRVGGGTVFLPRPARSRPVSFLSGSVSNSTQPSLQNCLLRSLCGPVLATSCHAMQCQHCARAVAYRQGTEMGHLASLAR